MGWCLSVTGVPGCGPVAENDCVRVLSESWSEKEDFLNSLVREDRRRRKKT